MTYNYTKANVTKWVIPYHHPLVRTLVLSQRIRMQRHGTGLMFVLRASRCSNASKALLSCDAFPLSRHGLHEPCIPPSRLRLPTLGPTPAILHREQRIGEPGMDDALCLCCPLFIHPSVYAVRYITDFAGSHAFDGASGTRALRIGR